MSIFSKFFFTIFGSSILAWLRDFVSRVTGDGGTLSDQGHTNEVYNDTVSYGPTLIQTCDSGGSTAQNFAVGSEDISNATYWAVSGVTATSDAEPNPFGGSGVSVVAETGSTTAKGIYQQSGYEASIVTRQAYTVSAYVKKGDGALAPDIIQITYLSGGFGTDFYANYNISTGVVTKVDGGFAEIQDIGGGWYRISLAGVAVATGALGTFVLAFVNNDPNATRLPSYTGNTSRDVYVWGVQFVQGNEPGEYIKTTTAAIDSIGTLYSIIPSRDLLLYQYTGAAAAYSLRSLSAGTTNVVKVRRSGDNAELDFTATEVSDGTLASWVTAGGGTEDGFVTTWYDQSGNTNNATQATAANQPKIVSSGTLVTENGKAALDFDGSNDSLVKTYNTSLNALTVFATTKFDGTIKTALSYLGTSHKKGNFVIRDNAYSQRFFDSDSDTDVVSITAKLTQQLITCIWDGSVPANSNTLPVDGTISSYQDGVLTDESASDSNFAVTGNGIYIGADPAPIYMDGTIQEIIIYPSDQSANRTGIEANINAHYNIYP